MKRLLLIATVACFPVISSAQGTGTPVGVTAVERGPVLDSITITGNVTPRRVSLVSTTVAGFVEEVYVDAGDFVEDGQPIGRLRSTPTELRLEAARAMTSTRKAQLEELMNGERPEDIAIQKANVGDLEARLDLAKLQEQRRRDLFEQKAVSQSELDEAVAERRRAESILAAEKARLLRLENGARPEVIAQARAEYDSANAAMMELEDELERHTIRAPFKGVIGARMAEVGQWLSTGDEVFAVAEVDVLRVEVNLPERFITSAQIGQDVRIVIDAVDNLQKTAPISYIIPVGNTASRSFPVRIDIDNSDRRFAPGMLARAEFSFPDRVSGESLLVPRDAVLLDGSRNRSVWVVRDTDEGTKVFSERIVTGREFQGKMQVLSGNLSDGDLVVSRGNELLRPQQSVRVVETIAVTSSD